VHSWIAAERLPQRERFLREVKAGGRRRRYKQDRGLSLPVGFHRTRFNVR
jgi:hypothetical protein